MWPYRRQPTRLPHSGILQARTLEWVAISFSNAWKWKVKVKSLSRVWLLATPWTAAYQAGSSVHGIFQARVLEWGAIAGPPKFICWNSSPTVMVSGDEAFERWLGHMGEPLNGISAPIKGTPESSSVSLPSNDTVKSQQPAARNRALTGTSPCWHPELGFPAPRTVSNKFLFFSLKYFNLFKFIFQLHSTACRIFSFLTRDHELNLDPRQRKQAFLTTGPAGNSLNSCSL